MKFEYLLFNCIIILGPLYALYKKKDIIKPKWKQALLATTITSLIFITYDWFAIPTFWEFNKKFIIGIYIGKLPIEEILFFITVPMSCILLYENIKIFSITKGEVSHLYLKIAIIFLTITTIYGLVNEKYYTGTIACIALCAITLDIMILKTNILKTKHFTIYIIIIILLTGIFNWYLTARPIVQYTNTMKTNIYILTIPIEDFIFGITMMAYHTIFYTQLIKISKKMQK